MLTLVDSRTNLSKETKMILHDKYGSAIKTFDSQISNTVKVAEASKLGQSIFAYDKNNKVAEAYSLFAKEVENIDKEQKRNAFTITR